MKVLVVLSLLALAIAEPDPAVLLYNSPLTPVATTKQFTAQYPYAGIPTISTNFRSTYTLPSPYTLPTTYSRLPFTYSPFVTSAGIKPVAGTPIVSSRTKRSADPEPEADPALVYTAGVAGTNINYPAIATFPTTTGAAYYPYHATTGLTGVSAYSLPGPYHRTTGLTGVSAYSLPGALPINQFGFPHYSPVVSNVHNVQTIKPVIRAKRDADPEPEADPALLYTTGLTTSPINYPAVATLPTTGVYYQSAGIPTTYNYPTTYTIPQTTTGLTYAGFNPYSTFPFFSTIKAKSD